ncbi:MAG: hypothetical protein H6595_11865 [Flavobacteriales bacterium]|nr:hypothetical protein [Flavobacteriales bacterium]MCB9168157.1 hypothetical protein [Flavobacteriales bacterium]MCB9194278.1 hypothetical protein [Flavobacteriales bacterium]
MRALIASYRLRFRRPFAIAHGTRDGTDSVFIRIDHNDLSGYGEATIPPYLGSTARSVVEDLTAWVGRAQRDEDPAMAIARLEELNGNTPARNALSMALIDLQCKRSYIPVYQYLKSYETGLPITLVTLGIGSTEDLHERIAELPSSGALKIKLGGERDDAVLRMLANIDARPLFLDANRSLRSVGQVVQLLEAAGPSNVIGLEQPFPEQEFAKFAELKSLGLVPVYGDESVQDITDLARWAEVLDGVNIKLMKCGGLDRARDMVAASRSAGLSVMLGSMSESSLGCTAMAHLASAADVVDLDGPWLLENDPFKGLGMDAAGRMILPGGSGIGADLIGDLAFEMIGA